MKEIDINNPDYQKHETMGGDILHKRQTVERLQEIKDLGLTVVGYGEFGIEGLMSGLYIERVWDYTDQMWSEYVNWIKSLKLK